MYLYHEKQVAALCGVHCINSLLQGSVFTEMDLAQIALELDELERSVMQEGGVTSEDYLKFAAEVSGNVANDGMFSIQVLQKALDVWGLSVIPLDHPDVKSAKTEPQSEMAFICNLQEHWFTIRSIHGEWWNLNSLFPAPQPLGQFYLSAFLGSLQEKGYAIFVVRGPLPQPQLPPTSSENGSSQGLWFTAEEAKVANEDSANARQRGKVANVVETAFSRAAAHGGTMQLRSKRGRGGGMLQGLSDQPDVEDYGEADLAAAIAASLSGVTSNAGPAGPSGSSAAPMDTEDYAGTPNIADADADADLAAAIAASLSDAPAVGEGPSSVPGAAMPPLSAAAMHRWGAAASSSSIQGMRLTGQGSDGEDSTGATAGGDTPPRLSAQQAQGGNSRGMFGLGEVGQDDDDADLAAAIAASLADQPGGGLPDDQQEIEEHTSTAADDPLPQEPEAGPGVVSLAFRLPNSSQQRVSRRFQLSASCNKVYDFVALSQGLPRHSIVLSTAFPRKDLSCSDTTLEALGLTEPQVLVVTLKPKT